jgi:hydroxyacylglutathione hydrolase
MQITVSPIPALQDNYAWLLYEPASGFTAVVDPPEVEPIVKALQQCGGRLDCILLTHHHADHIGGAEALAAQFGARIVGARKDRHRLPRLDEAVAEGDAVRLGPMTARVLETPGHTRGHIAYYVPEAKALFCGDTLFSLGCGRLFEGTAEEMFDSLQKLAALPEDTLVCCGHEYTASNARFALSVDAENAALKSRVAEVERLRAAGLPTVPSRLAEERAANPFLRAPDAVAFARLRTKKDKF